MGEGGIMFETFFEYEHYIALFTMSVVCIITGSYRSLHIVDRPEVMTSRDAALFPFLGSFVLFGLYMLFRYFDKELINTLLSGYFLLLGVFAIAQCLRPILHVISPSEYIQTFIQITWWDSSTSPRVTAADGVGLFFGLLVAYWYSVTKFWVANNIFGMCFAISAIEMMALGGFKVAAILLSGLFVYDIFWVFGTDVMVTVAKSVDHPIKLVWPKSGFWATDFSMIGLGDLVLPGILIAMLLRFDRDRRNRNAANGRKDDGNIYFNVCMLSYAVGLIVTVVVMHTFKAAQPALLYLVPATLGSTLFVAWRRGEVQMLMDYKEEASVAAVPAVSAVTTEKKNE